MLQTVWKQHCMKEATLMLLEHFHSPQQQHYKVWLITPPEWRWGCIREKRTTSKMNEVVLDFRRKTAALDGIVWRGVSNVQLCVCTPRTTWPGASNPEPLLKKGTVSWGLWGTATSTRLFADAPQRASSTTVSAWLHCGSQEGALRGCRHGPKDHRLHNNHFTGAVQLPVRRYLRTLTFYELLRGQLFL